jgi:hypothetical protein
LHHVIDEKSDPHLLLLTFVLKLKGPLLKLVISIPMPVILAITDTNTVYGVQIIDWFYGGYKITLRFIKYRFNQVTALLERYGFCVRIWLL